MEDYIGQIGPIPIRNAILFLYIGRFLLGTDQKMYHRHLAKITGSRFEILIFLKKQCFQMSHPTFWIFQVPQIRVPLVGPSLLGAGALGDERYLRCLLIQMLLNF